MLTIYDDDEDDYRALQAGAAAYVLKDALPEELAETIRAVHTGQTRVSPAVAVKLAGRLYEPELTPREQEVLRLLVAGKSNKEIKAALFLSTSTVKTHLSRLFKKLSVNDRTQAVMTALKRGLMRLE